MFAAAAKCTVLARYYVSEARIETTSPGMHHLQPPQKVLQTLSIRESNRNSPTERFFSSHGTEIMPLTADGTDRHGV